MTTYQSSLLDLLSSRDYIHQATDREGLDALAAREVVTGYVGFDATAPSLHVGSLVQIMLLRRLQQAGHRPIVVMGGGTTKVGDPSGKDESRQLLDAAGIEANIASIRKVFERFLRFDGSETGAIMVNNDEWLGSLNYLDLLREVGPHFTINRMLTFDSVKLRLEREQPLTFLEFNYMILQAYDFRELHARYGCRLQMGGSDQWGNICNGVELTRRMGGAEELFGVTTPLITTAEGKKMGKTAQGAVWLNADQLSAYDYWQFWRNTADADVIRFLKLFTDVPLEEIERLSNLSGQDINEAKIVLANATTAMLHGETAAKDAAETARRTFEEGASDANLPSLSTGGEIGIMAALTGLGFCASNGEAKRKIKEGAVKLDDTVVSDPQLLVTVAGDPVKLSLGKKKHGLLTA
ncbi:tyrosine--tRNA ligase [Sphingomicrobium astaxanthinifaciens]|uniref:tyrosine--tRNA ligase n=1 Tax=Sphingomicrobium astaxanthinifaciens TaxID=1227949 RepID=UPI001FCAAD01|nr:tyrosine--tRNA ligase [Sphingomicrobium astaxanthinifaciens]MCJ7422311.1 tyrosine--tRNA ligase [Sphingomicrobium astaxanthinifaciens]